ncbi:MAG: aldo/keto reductase [Coriobacteriia bacterium]|nr:aldo/keto reductase [Coriobacteriia bacterium]
MRFPRGIPTRIDMEKAEKIICEAIEQGVNYLDTAYVYGGSEEATGEVLEKHGLREKIHLATKLPHQKCKSYEDFDRFFNEQLARLRTTYIDYYLIHNMSDLQSWEHIQGLGIEKWLAEKKASGQIRNVGFSFHGSQKAFLSLLEVYDWDLAQMQYNYMNENYQAGRVGLQAAHAKGIVTVIMEPLLGGKLATGLPKKVSQLFQRADPSRSAAAWGLRWIWNQPEVTVVLSGMSAAEQVYDNVNTAADAVPNMLTEQEVAVLAAATEVFRNADKVPCTGCNYCMPCPKGVNIPGCFAAYNARAATGLVTGMSAYVTSVAANRPGSNAGPTNCVKCGACEKKCPQHIAIPAELENVKKKMEPFWFRLAIKIVQKFLS